MTNIELRKEVHESRFKHYEIAGELGIAETSFSRMLRKELSETQANKVRDAIARLKSEAVKS